jgi:catechol 2,3-dioxygenase-like lactoylglutathione lyase family enzyme
MATNYPINPRVRALGKARLDIARRAQSPADWQTLWKQPAHPFPFVWGERWKQCVEYRVDDFAAEIGFFIDILGLPVNAFDPDYAMFTSPQGDFFFAVVPAGDGDSTPPDAIRLQFMLDDIFATVEELESRGIAFEQPPQRVQPSAALHIATFRTPHGICIDLWGMLASLRPTLATAEAEDDEDVFLPSKDDDGLTLFTTQDAAPLKTKPPLLIRPTRQPQPLPAADDGEEDEFADLDEDDDSGEEDETIADLDEDDSENDDDDLEYVDIDTA